MRLAEYPESYRRAAADQGLCPLLEVLDQHPEPWALEQTGGWCMAVTIPNQDGTLAMIYDVNAWLAVQYPGNSWHDGEAEPHEGQSFDTLADLLTYLGVTA
jgi:hypothetical protein